MKVLITGAKGQVGQECALLLQQNNWDVIACDSRELNISDHAQVDDQFTRHRFDYVINCAAYTAVDRAEEQKAQAFLVNATGVKLLAEACRKQGIPLIHISTDYVFDGEKTGAYIETDKTNPINVYGATKLAGEETLRLTWEKHIILRTSWVFGRFGNNFVKTIIRLADERPELKIVADQCGSPTGAAHIAKVIFTILQHPQLSKNWGTYHYTDAPQTTWYDFAQSFVSAEKCKILPIRAAEYSAKARRPLNSELSCDKILNVFGIRQYAWQDELLRML